MSRLHSTSTQAGQSHPQRAEPCVGCHDGRALTIDLTMAFQPIIDISDGSTFAYEALVRGADGRSAGEVLASIKPEQIYRFDQACRVKAIELAGPLIDAESRSKLSINFMPNAVYEPNTCIKASLAAARRVGFDPTKLMFEFTEDERVRDVGRVRRIVEAYRARGFTTAIDDFGAGYAGLNLLADLRPDMIKIDMALVQGIDLSASRRTIVAAIVAIAREMEIGCIAEGIETASELCTLRNLGIHLCQGFLLAKPAIATLPYVDRSLIPNYTSCSD